MSFSMAYCWSPVGLAKNPPHPDWLCSALIWFRLASWNPLVGLIKANNRVLKVSVKVSPVSRGQVDGQNTTTRPATASQQHRPLRDLWRPQQDERRAAIQMDECGQAARLPHNGWSPARLLNQPVWSSLVSRC